MHHTKEHLRRQRGLYVMIAVLLVVWSMEPGLSAMSGLCRDLIERLYGGMQ